MAACSLFYLFDPLCGWCYGASPAISWLRQQAEVMLDYRPVGMFAWENGRPLVPQMRGYIRAADQRIAAMSGQPFTPAYFSQVIGQQGGLLESGPATLALHIVERRQPGRGLDFLQAMQTARYVEGRDVTDQAVLADIAGGLGVVAQDFAADWADPSVLKAARGWTAEGQRMMQSVNAEGVPTLLRRREDGSLRPLPTGLLYEPRERLAAALAA